MVDLERLEGAVEFAILVQPRSPRTEVGGSHDGALRVRVHAPPLEGQANEAVRNAVARTLSVRFSDVQLVAGQRGRRKRLRVQGDPGGLEARLRALADTPRPV
jgi:uncharacterized protein (TIGR00251 family)